MENRQYQYNSVGRTRARNSKVEWMFWIVIMIASLAALAAMFLPWGELTTSLKVTLESVSLDSYVRKLNFPGIWNSYGNLKDFSGSNASLLLSLLDLTPLLRVVGFASKVLLLAGISMSIAMVLNVVYLFLLALRARKALPVFAILAVAGDLIAWGGSRICLVMANTRIRDKLNALSILKKFENTVVDSVHLVDVGIGGWIVLGCGVLTLLMTILALVSRRLEA